MQKHDTFLLPCFRVLVIGPYEMGHEGNGVQTCGQFGFSPWDALLQSDPLQPIRLSLQCMATHPSSDTYLYIFISRLQLSLS